MQLRTVLGTLAVTGVATLATAQTLPHLARIQTTSPGVYRGVVVNPLREPLTAWSIDAIDKKGRPLISQRADAVLSPTNVIPAGGEREFEIAVGSSPDVTLAFRAGLTASGTEVGDLETALNLLETRVKRAAVLEDVLEYLRVREGTEPATNIKEQLLELVGKENSIVLDDVSQRLPSPTVAGWRKASEEVRDINQRGAARYGVLRERIKADKLQQEGRNL